jgi:lysozyme
MRINNEGLDLIKRWEGFEMHAYLCPAGVPTIGYGATYYPNNRNAVKLTDRPISESYASLLLEDMVKHYEAGVSRYVSVELINLVHWYHLHIMWA